MRYIGDVFVCIFTDVSLTFSPSHQQSGLLFKSRQYFVVGTPGTAWKITTIVLLKFNESCVVILQQCTCLRIFTALQLFKVLLGCILPSTKL